jgi:hypothetical protein
MVKRKGQDLVEAFELAVAPSAAPEADQPAPHGRFREGRVRGGRLEVARLLARALGAGCRSLRRPGTGGLPVGQREVGLPGTGQPGATQTSLPETERAPPRWSDAREG